MKLTNFDVFWCKMPLANVHIPFCYLFSETCVDNFVSRYNVQKRLSPAFLVFFCFFSEEGGILKYRFVGTLAFMTRRTQILSSLLQASLNTFSLCNGSQILVCTFDVTKRPEFPSNNIFARDWAASRHSVGETMLLLKISVIKLCRHV